MSDRDKLEKSLENEEEHLEELSNAIKGSVDLLPHIEERKKEVRAKKKFVKEMPSDYVDEVSKSLLSIQTDSEKSLGLAVEGYAIANDEISRQFLYDTSGTSVYSEMTYKIWKFQPVSYSEAEGVIEAFGNLAKEKSRKVEVPKRLNMIQEGLGDRFKIVQDNVEKARNGVMRINQVLMDMRSFLIDFWGNLARLSKEVAPEDFIGIQSNKLRNERVRGAVAKSLTKKIEDEKKLILYLNNVHDLHNDLSDRTNAKNILIEDVRKLDQFYDRWILIIDDIVGMIPSEGA